jgi:hypothetical protein
VAADLGAEHTVLAADTDLPAAGIYLGRAARLPVVEDADRAKLWVAFAEWFELPRLRATRD